MKLSNHRATKHLSYITWRTWSTPERTTCVDAACFHSFFSDLLYPWGPDWPDTAMLSVSDVGRCYSVCDKHGPRHVSSEDWGSHQHRDL